MASKKPQSPAMEFLLSALKTDRKASYADIKAKAAEKKLDLYPIMFGRAQAMLGIVKSAKRGTSKHAKANATAKTGKAPKASSAGKRGRKPDATSKSAQVRALLATDMDAASIAKKVGCTVGLVYVVKSHMGKPRKQSPKRTVSAPTSSRLDGIAGILDMVKNSERERTQLRGALEKIQAVIAGVMAS